MRTTFIIGVLNAQEIHQAQMIPTFYVAEAKERIINYLGKRHCKYEEDNDVLVIEVDEALSQDNRIELSKLVREKCGDVLYLWFFEGENVREILETECDNNYVYSKLS